MVLSKILHHACALDDILHLRKFLSFLEECKALTRGGSRLLLETVNSSGLTVKAEHVRQQAQRFFLDCRTEPQACWANRWQSYRESYDLHKPPRATPWQKLLIRFTENRDERELFLQLGKVPEVMAAIQKAACSVKDYPEKNLLVTLLSILDGTLPAADAPSEHLLRLLPYLNTPAPERLNLAHRAFASLDDDAKLGAAVLLSRCCNLSKSERPEASLSLDPEICRALREQLEAWAGEGDWTALSALRTLGTPETLQKIPSASDLKVTYGGRPGKAVWPALVEEVRVLAQQRSFRTRQEGPRADGNP